MTGQTHRIGELRFHLKAPDGAVAESWGRAVEAMAETRLLPLIEAAFDRLAPDRVLVLDRLDLNLGALGADPVALETALETALAAALAQLQGPQAGQGSAILSPDPVALIATYLLRGGLPLPGPDAALQAAWAEVAALSPPGLSRALVRLASLCGNASAARRLVASAPRGLLRAMALALAGLPAPQAAAPDAMAAPEAAIVAALQGLALSPADPAAAAALAAALGMQQALPPALTDRFASPAVPKPAAGPARHSPPTAAEAEDPLLFAVPAAGLVLLHPFLAAYFDCLGLLAGPGRFADIHARSLAVRLAQRLATGENTAPEADCVLAKLLCGMDPAEALVSDSPRGPAADRIAAEADHLLTTVIGHWAKLGHTSPEGLREAFLRRPGLVRRHGDGWRLSVERRGTDVLLDSLPWTIGLVRTPFMTTLLRVDWR